MSDILYQVDCTTDLRVVQSIGEHATYMEYVKQTLIGELVSKLYLKAQFTQVEYDDTNTIVTSCRVIIATEEEFKEAVRQAVEKELTGGSGNDD